MNLYWRNVYTMSNGEISHGSPHLVREDAELFGTFGRRRGNRIGVELCARAPRHPRDTIICFYPCEAIA